jgi:hypothetical protein
MRLRDGTDTQDPRLDRLVFFDERSRGFPVRAVISAQAVPRSFTWVVGQHLDQGNLGACPGMSVTHELMSRPVAVPNLTDQFAIELYWDAQRIDSWPGGSYASASPFYEGTAVIFAVKVAQDRGYYVSYRWCFSETDLALAVSYKGPVILGIPWYEGMMTPDATGFVRPTGNIVGGHAILCYGLELSGDGYYKLWNSWGPLWADNGSCYVSRADLARLLSEDGEACVPVGRRFVK